MEAPGAAGLDSHVVSYEDDLAEYIVVPELEAAFNASHQDTSSELDPETISERLERMKERVLLGSKAMDCTSDTPQNSGLPDFLTDCASQGFPPRFSDLLTEGSTVDSLSGALPDADKVEEFQRKISEFAKKQSGKPKVRPTRDLEDFQATAAFLMKEISNGEEDEDVLKFWIGTPEQKQEEALPADGARIDISPTHDEHEPLGYYMSDVTSSEHQKATEDNLKEYAFSAKSIVSPSAGKDFFSADFFTSADELSKLIEDLEVQ